MGGEDEGFVDVVFAFLVFVVVVVVVGEAAGGGGEEFLVAGDEEVGGGAERGVGAVLDGGVEGDSTSRAGGAFFLLVLESSVFIVSLNSSG